ncbi:MFS transporter [Streptomyces sp. NPDC048659]|uniref:MFS transporter n=1 Tax=Streptomyces sp. NPDC048659 TaxID=3155489 RepID=UPI00343FBF53
MSATAPALDPRRWQALVFIAMAQLLVNLDHTIINIALPSAQTDLGISDGNRQWAITAYALAFGGLLLFGGRIADLWGRRRTFVTGLVGFAAASVLGGAATEQWMLYSARALQGTFAALLAPAALSLLAVLFTDAAERGKAFGIYAAVSGSGAAIGLLLGGALTDYLNWRWSLYVLIPFALVAAAGAVLTIREPAEGRNRSPLDVPGTILSTVGLVALVYGFAHAEESGWGDARTLGLLAGALVLLVAFVVLESKVRHPLLPLRVLTDRNRGGAFLALGLAIIALFGIFLFLTYYLQVVKAYSPVTTGLAFLPLSVGLIAGSTQIGARLLPRVAPRALMVPGLLAAAVGLLLLTQIDVDSSYATLVLPGQLLFGLGLGATMIPAISLATVGVRPSDAGVASAMVNTSQQIGGAIGTALLNTIAASVTGTYVASHAAGAADAGRVQLDGMVSGFTTAFWWSAGIVLVAALLVAVCVTAGPLGGPPAAEGPGDGDGADAGAGDSAGAGAGAEGSAAAGGAPRPAPVSGA